MSLLKFALHNAMEIRHAQHPPRFPSLPASSTTMAQQQTTKNVAFEIISITIGAHTLRLKGDKASDRLYLSLDRTNKVYNIVSEDDVLQPPGNHLIIPASTIQWAVYSQWSNKIALLPIDKSSSVLIEMPNDQAAQDVVRQIKEETGIELDVTSKVNMDKIFEGKPL